MANLYRTKISQSCSTSLALRAYNDIQALTGGYVVSLSMGRNSGSISSLVGTNYGVITFAAQHLNKLITALSCIYNVFIDIEATQNLRVADIDLSHCENKLKVLHFQNDNMIIIKQTERVNAEDVIVGAVCVSTIELSDLTELMNSLITTRNIVVLACASNIKDMITVAREINQAQEDLEQWGSIYMKNDGSYMRFDNHSKGMDCTVNISEDGIARINVNCRTESLDKTVKLDAQSINDCINDLYNTLQAQTLP